MRVDKEKRRATSREAARKRRRVESDMFADLSRLLPLHPSVREGLDKPSVIRLTLSYIRAHMLLKEVRVRPAGRSGTLEDASAPREEQQDVLEETNMLLSVLEGFLMVLSTEGDVIFLSENVSQHMGLTQTELMGHNVFEFTHPCDHQEIRNNLCLIAEGSGCGPDRDFVVRVKSALTYRGRHANLKSASWKVLRCRGRAKARLGPAAVSCLLLTCQPLPLSHTLLSTHTFTSQHSMDMRFTHCDPRVILLLGYRPEELLGRSIYQVCHTLDAPSLARSHLNLCLKSLSVSGRYRILVKGGGYVWVETHSAVIPSAAASRARPGAPQTLCILCVTYVLSGVEEASLQLSLDQNVPRYLK